MQENKDFARSLKSFSIGLLYLTALLMTSRPWRRAFVRMCVCVSYVEQSLHFSSLQEVVTPNTYMHPQYA